ncbi:MAG: FHA domain-containing protein [Chloroflexota bacterium]
MTIWGATVAFVAWDTSRRNLTGCQQFMWAGLAMVPLIGFAAYLIARPLFIPGSDDLVEDGNRLKKRVTFLKPAGSGAPKRLPTIPAAEYLRAARSEQYQAGQGWASGEPVEELSYILVVAAGSHAGENFVLDNLPAIIGRGSGCAIRLDNDRGVSRRHAELYRQAGKLRLRDLDSTHGTRVNGYDIDDKGLTPGDKIHIGYSLLIVKTDMPG